MYTRNVVNDKAMTNIWRRYLLAGDWAFSLNIHFVYGDILSFLFTFCDPEPGHLLHTKNLIFKDNSSEKVNRIFNKITFLAIEICVMV